MKVTFEGVQQFLHLLRFPHRGSIQGPRLKEGRGAHEQAHRLARVANPVVVGNSHHGPSEFREALHDLYTYMIYIYIHTHTSARARAHTHTHTHTYIYTHTHTHAHTHTYKYMYMYIYIDVFVMRI